MAAVFEQVVENSFLSSGDTITINSVKAGSTLVLAIRTGDNLSNVSVSDNVGGAMTVIDSTSASGYYGGMFYLANAAAGTHIATITYTGGAFALFVAFSEISGVATSSPLDQHSIAVDQTGSPTNSGTTGTLAQANEMIIGWSAFIGTANNIAAVSPGVLKTATSLKYALSADVIAATTGLSRGFTYSNGQQNHTMVATFIPAASGASMWYAALV